MQSRRFALMNELPQARLRTCRALELHVKNAVVHINTARTTAGWVQARSAQGFSPITNLETRA